MSSSIVFFFETRGALEDRLRELGILVTSGGSTNPAPGYLYAYLGPQRAGTQRLSGVAALLDFDAAVLTAAQISAAVLALDPQTYKGNEPLAAVLARPYQTAPKTLKGKIRAEALRLLQEGGFKTVDNPPVWLPSDNAFAGLLAALMNLGPLIPNGTRVETMDGKLYPIGSTNKARDTLVALMNQRVAILNARQANIAAVDAGTLTRMEDAVWPEVYGPANSEE